MRKKIIYLLIFFLGAEILMLWVFATSFSFYSKETLKTTNLINENPSIPLNLPNTLSLRGQEKSFMVDTNMLEALSPQKTIELNEKSIDYYLLSQIGYTPWTNPILFDKVKSLVWNDQEIGQYLLNLSAQINRPAKDAELTIENDRATTFSPHVYGQILDRAQARKLISKALLNQESNVNLPITSSSPKVKLSQLNSLGIQDFLGRGQSDFSGSSAARIQNIKAGAAQYRGVIVKPGEEFSFNKYLGPVDATHGYLPELVIKPAGATPEFGGGLCQVSTTAFRAAFFTGLPITARKNHSYAVKYYEWISDEVPRAVGLDATIYTGMQDMKFVNDTPGAILIWTHTEGKRLYFDFYGTADGRKIVVDGPHPYDRKPSGAVKSKVTRIVTKPGEMPVELTYNSRYVPPKTLPAVVEYPPKPAEATQPSNNPAPPAVQNN